MAGAEGFEPPKAVLETAGLPLAYAPLSRQIILQAIKLAARQELALPFSARCTKKGRAPNFPFLLRFTMPLMLAAKGAKLLHFKTLSSRLLIFRLAVIAVLAFTALQLNNFTRHIGSPDPSLL